MKQLKPLKKRLTEHKLYKRGEKIYRRLWKQNKTQEKDRIPEWK